MKMIFLAQIQVKGICFNPVRPEGLVFSPESQCNLKIALKPEGKNDDVTFRSRLSCKVQIELDVSKEIYEFISSIVCKKYIAKRGDTLSLPRVVGGREVIDIDGNVVSDYILPLKYYPVSCQEVIKSTHKILIEKANRFLKLIRWRQGIQADHDFIEFSSLYVKSLAKFYLLPDYSHEQTFPTITGIRWEDQHEEDIATLWCRENNVEPIGHELIREAINLYPASPRSAILIAASALEAATKAHCALIAPDTMWLLEKAPSPPIDKILREFIPQIRKVRNNDLSFWQLGFSEHFSKTKKVFEIRNKIAHTGYLPISPLFLDEYFDILSDLIYVLDVISGHEWAKTKVSWKVRNKLGWPHPESPEMYVTVMEQE